MESFRNQTAQDAVPANTIVGKILERDRKHRFLTVLSETDTPARVIRFAVPCDTPIINRAGRYISFSLLVPGMRVQVHHAVFMTASIPPQTTALEIKVL